MSNQMKRVDVINDNGDIVTYFNSVSEAARAYDVHHCTVLYWIAVGLKKKGLSFKFHNEADVSLSRTYSRKIKPIQAKKLDKEKYTIVKYEVINKRVSITPCPYKQHPKPMVGSAACLKCCSNKGVGRFAHEVACNKK